MTNLMFSLLIMHFLCLPRHVLQRIPVPATTNARMNVICVCVCVFAFVCVCGYVNRIAWARSMGLVEGYGVALKHCPAN